MYVCFGYMGILNFSWPRCLLVLYSGLKLWDALCYENLSNNNFGGATQNSSNFVLIPIICAQSVAKIIKSKIMYRRQHIRVLHICRNVQYSDKMSVQRNDCFFLSDVSSIPFYKALFCFYCRCSLQFQIEKTQYCKFINKQQNKHLPLVLKL